MSASHLGELSSNLTSAKIFINDLVELGPTQILHPCTCVKAGRGDFLPDKGVKLLIRNKNIKDDNSCYAIY